MANGLHDVQYGGLLVLIINHMASLFMTLITKHEQCHSVAESLICLFICLLKGSTLSDAVATVVLLFFPLTLLMQLFVIGL